MKTYSDKIATWGVIVAVVAIIASLATPEIRQWIFGSNEEPLTDVKPGPDSNSTHPTVPPVDTSLNQPRKATIEKVYTGLVKDSSGKRMAHLLVSCQNCDNKQTYTDANGNFKLTRKFENNSEFQVTLIYLSNGSKEISININWRDESPDAIIF